jgi:hypothetical protein
MNYKKRSCENARDDKIKFLKIARNLAKKKQTYGKRCGTI